MMTQQRASSSASGPAADVIADLAWDPRGERLAVLLKHNHAAAGGGCVALYATSPQDAVVTPRLLGFARPTTPPACVSASGMPTSGVSSTPNVADGASSRDQTQAGAPGSAGDALPSASQAGGGGAGSSAPAVPGALAFMSAPAAAAAGLGALMSQRYSVDALNCLAMHF